MENYLLQIIKDTTEYIEKNILEPVNLDSISEHVNLSKFHLLRIWKGATATGLMEYVRRRRIALSLGDLLHSKNSLEFISSKYSFGCERSYNRVFNEEFGLSPGKWRKNPCPLNILDRFNADFMNCAGDGLVFMKSTTVLPAFSLAGHEYSIHTADNMVNQTANRYGVDFFYKDRNRIINPVEKNIYIGFTSVPEKDDRVTLYMPSVQIDQNSIIPPDMTTRRVDAHKYGVFTYMGPHSPEEISAATLVKLWNYIFEIWMPTIQFNLKETFSFEQINYAKCNRHYCECDLYFPISTL
ncbi:MAG: helix-turn-helix domain-containing protein [Ruminiclostridium sp.]|nr:helix-turn-helix domain-containing protein [Ruminiclostridium sp.]